jgi:hypothetical protein
LRYRFRQKPEAGALAKVHQLVLSGSGKDISNVASSESTGGLCEHVGLLSSRIRGVEDDLPLLHRLSMEATAQVPVSGVKFVTTILVDATGGAVVDERGPVAL